MFSFPSRRTFLASLAGGAALSPARILRAQAASPVETTRIIQGDLEVNFRDNTLSPGVLSGVDSLFNLQDAPGFDAFDPDSPPASAGLNFEHIICGHSNPHNRFAPRTGKYELSALPDGKSVQLVRKAEDDPWSMSSTLTYTVTKPHAINVDFQCIPHDRAVFGQRGYAILFFANYMNDVESVALNFLGVNGPDRTPEWIAADAPPGHPDWKQGGTYRSQPAVGTEYDADHNFKINSWSYDYPRFTEPFYYGRASRGMVLSMMFNKLYTPVDEIRFSLFKFKIPRAPRPAWDFQYVIRNIEVGRQYGFQARLVWKKFVSPEDCLNEYQSWKASLSGA